MLEGRTDERERVREALITLADGRVGVSAPLLANMAQPWMVAAGVYDGEGPETHLLTGPVLTPLAAGVDGETAVGREFDLYTGVLRETFDAADGTIESVRFASLIRPGIVVTRTVAPPSTQFASELLSPSDDEPHDSGVSGDVHWMRVAATSGGIAAAALHVDAAASPEKTRQIVDRLVAYASDSQTLPDASLAVQRVQAAADLGFDALLTEHREAWARRWDDADIVVEGDDQLQLAIRFSLFHLMGSVGDEGEAAVGARGLTGTSYRGHVFWDADTFVLPFLAATHPSSARAMLEYRIRRLPAALAAARARGREGARFPWESARTGFDVTPPSALDRAGRVVSIRTGLLEEHIVAEVAWAASSYVDWTGDEDFERGPGLALLVETARYWASRIRVDRDGSAHIYGVIGPDEYHEPVDDNAFTNVMARWNLRSAAAAVERFHDADQDVTADERAHWRALATALVDGFDPATGVYEQFAGFRRLEPLIVEEVAPRRPIAADLLLGANRVRNSQVLKQADVLMLHHLVPDEVEPDTLEPNLRFYEPRTAHGSSLSPAVHASLLARARDYQLALDALEIASRIDLDDLTESTGGGLHLATMGGVWQAMAFGFAGVRPREGRLEIDPHLPPVWDRLEVHVRFQGSGVRVRVDHRDLVVMTDSSIDVLVGGAPFRVESGTIQFRARGPSWEVVA
jgi:trehalose/maltose hydrolase-like predicted phosphorylase